MWCGWRAIFSFLVFLFIFLRLFPCFVISSWATCGTEVSKKRLLCSPGLTLDKSDFCSEGSRFRHIYVECRCCHLTLVMMEYPKCWCKKTYITMLVCPKSTWRWSSCGTFWKIKKKSTHSLRRDKTLSGIVSVCKSLQDLKTYLSMTTPLLD